MTDTYPWYNDASEKFMQRDYLLPGQTITERIDQIAQEAERRLRVVGFANKFKMYMRSGFYSLSSPVWTNFGTDRGLPISCFGSYVADNMESILGTHAEIGMMSKNGGGTSVYFGDIRPRGADINGGKNGKSAGSVHFMQLFDKVINVVSQGSSRKGQCAVYLPIEHPDTEEFLQIRHEGNPIQSLSTGVCVSNDFMEKMIAGDDRSRTLWAMVLSSRAQTGYPYIFFQDNANDSKPQVYKDQGMWINNSNLCTEIMLPNNEDESFVCDLSSMNVLHYNEWRDTDAVRTLVFFLDAVMSEFIEKANDLWGMHRAVNFAKRHRALGVGWLGWHSFLQSVSVPFESLEAKGLCHEVGKKIHDDAYAASAQLAAIFGEPVYLRGYGRRNTTLVAIAPTKASSFILGQVSEGVEPIRSNYHIRDVQKGKFSVRNPQLAQLLEEYGRNNEETWQSVLKNDGSVQHFEWMSDHDKDVFKTFAEISPMEIVQQCVVRQKFVDQGQSVNLMIDPNLPAKEVNAIVIEAWRMGIKALYYQISVNAAQQFAKSITQCASCES